MKFSTSALMAVCGASAVSSFLPVNAFTSSPPLQRPPFQVQRAASLLSSLFAASSNNNNGDESTAQSSLYYAAKTNAALNRYQQEHARSIDPATADEYWADKARYYLDWDVPFTTPVLQGNLQQANVRWFEGGKLNVAYNAIDRHVAGGRGDAIALVWEGDEPDDIRRFTYKQLQEQVSRIANALKSVGVQKGHVVTIYMPMVPELAMTMLACARIGAVHSVVFAGFSAEALAARITAANSKFLVTADQGVRGGKTIPLKQIVNQARTVERVEDCLEQVLVWERFYHHHDDDNDDNKDGESSKKPTATAPYEMLHKDVRMDPLVAKQRPYCPVVSQDAEDTLFILYTSGSTGQPKGVVHTTGGYALYAAMTTHQTFDLNTAAAAASGNGSSSGDIFACVADCGWITGHTYVVYGPLLNGATTFLFEGTPLYPSPARYWEMIERHSITQFYTAPTAIRSLMRFGDKVPLSYSMSSLKILGSVGEPINAAAWEWYYDNVGKQQCTIVDTYWQTETGGHIITNLPGVTDMKPGSCTLPFYGIDPVLLDSVTGEEVVANSDDGSMEGVLALRRPWPGMARTCLNDHDRYQTVYLKPYPGYYFTGDSCMRDADGYHFITGRVDDVLNVSGHRIGTAEVESALVAHPAVAQAAVVGKQHAIKGESITGFVMLAQDFDESTELILELRNQVRAEIGPFASPDVLWVAPSLPMTRSGKIMRRILRKIVAGETDSLGDTSTLADPSIVGVLIEKVNASSEKTKTKKAAAKKGETTTTGAAASS